VRRLREDDVPMEATEARRDAAKPLLVRVARIAAWLAGIALFLFVLEQLGVPVSDWIDKFFDQLGAVPISAVAGGIVLETLQTTLAALAWVAILRAAFPDAQLPFRQVLAAYAVAVALNGFLPANIGSLVMMLMFVTLIAGATFAAVFSGFIVQKIPFSVFNVASYIYLFVTVAGSLSIKLGFLADHPVASVVIVLGAVALLVLLARVFWRRATKLREQIKNGGAILAQPRRFLVGVALPELGSYLARLGIIAVFMAAYSIPVSFHSVIAVSASNSVSNSVSLTPGGAGVNQAFNVAVLGGTTSTSTAAAYSLAQQLIITAWDVVFAIVLVAWVFGWSGGKALVKKSYADAEAKEHARKEQRAAQHATGRRRWRIHL
jgi:phosphatidylinositol alpha-mannosyltransferase